MEMTGRILFAGELDKFDIILVHNGKVSNVLTPNSQRLNDSNNDCDEKN